MGKGEEQRSRQGTQRSQTPTGRESLKTADREDGVLWKRKEISLELEGQARAKPRRAEQVGWGSQGKETWLTERLKHLQPDCI